MPNVEFVHGDVYRTGLPDGAFDLVHVRFVAGTAGAPETLLREAIRLTRWPMLHDVEGVLAETAIFAEINGRNVRCLS